MCDPLTKADRRLLVILENDGMAGEGLALLARDAGYEPAIFTSLAEALQAGIEGLIAIITDFDLGVGPNGIEAAHALRADRQPAPPVLVVTATSQGHVESAARAAGFDLLEKPASPAFLRRWLADKAGVA